MLLISLAGAALVSRGTLTLFYAALASIAVLLEQSYWVLVQDSSTANYVQPGLLSIGYFATALITNRLARRLILNERLAQQRGADLADQLRINRLIIRDVQDGVLDVADDQSIDAKLVGERSEEHTSELQSLRHLVCRLLLEKKKKECYQF